MSATAETCTCEPGACRVDQMMRSDTDGELGKAAWRRLYQSCAERHRRQAEYAAEREEKQRFEAEAAAEQRRQENARLAELDTFDPVPFLRDLRETVLAAGHTRLPKWRFRFADDFALQLQPKPAEQRDRFRLFEGLAILGAGIKRRHFDTIKSQRGTGLASVKFGIADTGVVKARYRGGDAPGRWRVWVDLVTKSSVKFEVLERLRAALLTMGDMPASRMFEPSCLICGKPLTDPASMARMVGPECAGTSSLVAGELRGLDWAPYLRREQKGLARRKGGPRAVRLPGDWRALLDGIFGPDAVHEFGREVPARRPAILVTVNALDTGWAHAMHRECAVLFLVHGRINYLDATGQRLGSNPKGTVIWLFSDNADDRERFVGALRGRGAAVSGHIPPACWQGIQARIAEIQGTSGGCGPFTPTLP
jgi:hypothetical protein